MELGDRVMNILDRGKVPLGARGTVVAMHGDLVEVVFDEELLSGTTLSGKYVDIAQARHSSKRRLHVV